MEQLVESRYNVLQVGRKKVRCNGSTLYPDLEFSRKIVTWGKVRYNNGYVVNLVRCNATRLYNFDVVFTVHYCFPKSLRVSN